jgi:hypothetical protein
MNSRRFMCSIQAEEHTLTHRRKAVLASQHFGPSDFRNGSTPAFSRTSKACKGLEADVWAGTQCAIRAHRSIKWRGVAAGQLIGRIADRDGSSR